MKVRCESDTVEWRELVVGGQEVSGTLLHFAGHGGTLDRGGGRRGGEEDGKLRAVVGDEARGLLDGRQKGGERENILVGLQLRGSVCEG